MVKTYVAHIKQSLTAKQKWELSDIVYRETRLTHEVSIEDGMIVSLHQNNIRNFVKFYPKYFLPLKSNNSKKNN